MDRPPTDHDPGGAIPDEPSHEFTDGPYGWITHIDLASTEPDATKAWCSTVLGWTFSPQFSADGRPHVSPLVTVWLDEALYFTTGPEEQKARNLEQNPRVAVTTGQNGWEGGIDVTVEGEVRRVLDPDLLERLAEAWLERWDGSWAFRVGDGVFRHASGAVSHVFEVVPTKALAFSKSPFGQTRHRFGHQEGADRS